MKFLLCIILFIPSLVNANLFRKEEEFVKNVPVYACRTVEQSCDDVNLVNRIIVAYQFAEKKHLGNSMWQIFYDQRHQGIHNIFQSGNFAQASYVLRNPGQTDLFYGFDGLCSSFLQQMITYDGLVSTATQSLDRLVRFGEAIGAIRLDDELVRGTKRWYANELMNKIEAKLGITIYFPNPYPDEIGIYTNRGTASYRAIQALYQAYLIKELLKDIPNPRVLEIGAGLGRTAYYCSKFGITNYTIVDIPMTILSSSYFLGRTLGQEHVVLLGENLSNSENKVKFLTPDQFLDDGSHYDLIVNFDSLTEIDINTILLYLNKIQQSCPIFLSVNHEANSYSIFELLSDSPNVKKMQRKPYWMRIGYAEELYIFNQYTDLK